MGINARALTKIEIESIKAQYDGFCVNNFFEKDVNLPKKLVFHVRDKLFENILVRKVFKYAQNPSFVSEVLLLLLVTAFNVLANSTFFYFDKDNDKLVTRKNLFSLDSIEELKETILTYFLESDNYCIDPGMQEFLVDILFHFFQGLVKKPEFFECKVEKFGLPLKDFGDMRRMNAEQRWTMRILIAKCLMKGMRICEIAKLFNVNRKTVSVIAKKLRENPDLTCSDLVEKKRGPAPNPYSIITKEAFDALVAALTEKTPLDFGIDCSTWTAYAVLEYLDQEHDIQVSLRYLYFFVARMDVTSKFASRINFKQDPAQKEAYLARYYDICMRALNEGRMLLFGDETSTMRGHHARGYARKGKRTHLSYNQALLHTNESALIFMSPEGFMKPYTVKGAFTSKKFIQKLNHLRVDYEGQKYLIILDNCAVHKSKEVRAWLEQLAKDGDDTFVFEWLPPYYPELNPVEQFNNYYKGHLAKKASKTPEEVSRDSEDFFWELSNRKDKETFIKHFFMGEQCAYSILQYSTAKRDFEKKAA